jgi:multidrug efflux pump subunit AcrA (membrane-fusion protein)
MVRHYLLPLLAVVGIAVAIWAVVTGNRPVPTAPPVAPPAQAPFASSVVGAGLLEPNTQNIAIGTPVSGVVTAVLVTVGETVQADAPLFTLDDRAVQAELVVRRAPLQTHQARVAKLLRQPRPEEVPPEEAKVQAAEAALGNARYQLELGKGVEKVGALSMAERERRRWVMRVDEAKLAEARAHLALLCAGAWEPDLEIAQTQVAMAEAQVKQTETEIERLTVRAPVSGEILQVNLRRGEFAQAGSLATPLMVLGNVEPLHVRVEIDEHDVWRVRPEASAVAVMRGNRAFTIPLRFVRFEPAMVPKKALTGESTERVDTRVLQVLYRFTRGALPVYVGQQMEVYIAAPPSGSLPESVTQSGS